MCTKSQLIKLAVANKSERVFFFFLNRCRVTSTCSTTRVNTSFQRAGRGFIGKQVEPFRIAKVSRSASLARSSGSRGGELLLTTWRNLRFLHQSAERGTPLLNSRLCRACCFSSSRKLCLFSPSFQAGRPAGRGEKLPGNCAVTSSFLPSDGAMASCLCAVCSVCWPL